MHTEAEAILLGPDQRCWRPYLLNAATTFVYWLLATLLFVIAVFAGSITRFEPGAPLPESRLTVMVVPDPDNPEGLPKVIKTSELVKFRADHPGARLALAPCATTTLEPDTPRKRHSYRVTYSARDLGGGRTEMTVRGSTPFVDSPGSFGYIVLRYTITGERIEPLAMVAFDPFMTWFAGAILGFVVSLGIGRGMEKWLIDRPFAQGRWRMLPPLNRDWLVTRGIPFRFSPAPPSLDCLAEALRRGGATLRHQPDQAALRASFGRCAGLTVNLRPLGKSPPELTALIDGGLSPLATLLVILVAPLTGLSAAAMMLFWLLDPFTAFTDSAAWMSTLIALAVISAVTGLRWLQRPGLTDEGNRLATILFDTLGAQGSISTALPRWPRLKPPLPKWRRWLPRIAFGALVVLPFVPLLWEILTDLLR
jgi:hypothetical protein